MSDKLDALDAAREGLTSEARRDFLNYFVGALAAASSGIDEAVWANAIEVAADIVARTVPAVEHSTTSPGAAGTPMTAAPVSIFERESA